MSQRCGIKNLPLLLLTSIAITITVYYSVGSFSIRQYKAVIQQATTTVYVCVCVCVTIAAHIWSFTVGITCHTNTVVWVSTAFPVQFRQ